MQIDTRAHKPHPVTLVLLALCAIGLFSISSVSVAGERKSVYMPLGEPMLPPFSFTRFCMRKPTRRPVSADIRQIPLTAETRRVLEGVQRGVNNELRAGL